MNMQHTTMNRLSLVCDLPAFPNHDPCNNNPPPSYAESQRTSNGGVVTLTFRPDMHTPQYEATSGPSSSSVHQFTSSAVPWHAELTIHTAHLAALFAHGLHWSCANMTSTRFLVRNGRATFKSDMVRDAGYQHCIVFPLADDAAPAQWNGTLSVYANDVAALRAFRPETLSKDHVRFAAVRDAAERQVYRFDRSGVLGNFSTLTGTQPLAGWWPWPKAGK
ncbi:hypothetical protein LMH87_002335 [Akanthomyces muscarius]|uniref:Uncharacterized protein n=1 Tax=Akanthomyces muscarius TaxID=2231603 RepID=A0A9W8UJJ4_AKAMU|nr:hypothetical protein LMH87_002335 [Akanthomyces muscarius]KAJ4147833.1 hypothetical protein LMH87_002335 [Akanthomyces muscarius]